MATTTSKLGVTIKALYDLFSAHQDLNDLKHASGNRSQAFLGVEYLVVAVEATATQDYAATGNRYKYEIMDIECELLVQVAGAGETVMEASRVRALEKLAVIEDILRTNKTLGIAGMNVAEVVRYNMRQGFTDKHYIQLMSIFIRANCSLLS